MMLFALAVSAATLGALVVALWLASLALRDSSIVDVAWGPLYVVVAAVLIAALRPEGARAALLVALVAAWGLRLGVHLFVRNRGRPEDPRYRAWRDEAGASWWWRSLFKVFLLQGAVAWVVALVFVVPLAQAPGAPLGWLDALGALVWLVGFGFESVGDAQLARFKRDPANRGKVMDRGLWRYSRHPNYFGESLIWWGLLPVAFAGGAPWWVVVSPALMTFLLLRVSGVAMLEKGLRSTKPGYEEYVRRTSAFVPMPPRR